MLKKKHQVNPGCFLEMNLMKDALGRNEKKPKLCVCSTAKQETAKESRFSEVQESVSSQGAWGWGIPQQIKGQQNL